MSCIDRDISVAFAGAVSPSALLPPRHSQLPTSKPVTWADIQGRSVLVVVMLRFPRPHQVHFPCSAAPLSLEKSAALASISVEALLRRHLWSWGESNPPARFGVLPAQGLSSLVRVCFRMSCSNRQ